LLETLAVGFGRMLPAEAIELGGAARFFKAQIFTL
jgi:hypothetical protein